MNKICIKCKEEKILDEFPKNCCNKAGYRNICKKCNNLKSKEFRSNNKEKIVNYHKQYEMLNSEHLKLYRKNFYSEYNKGRCKEHLRKSNNDKLYQKNYREKTSESRKMYQKDYRQKNREKLNEYKRLYNKNNRHIKAWRTVLQNVLKRFNKKKEGKTIDLLGYSATDLKNHITNLFTEGMSWDNYGEWHIDHVKGVKTFSPDTPLNIVNALANLQPLWAKDNLRKK